MSVTLAGLEAHAITFENDTLVVAVAADGLEQYGSIRLTANSGAVLEITDSWRFIPPSKINEITPSAGQYGTLAVIQRSRMLGGGNKITEVVLAGTAAKVIGGTDNTVSVRAQHGDKQEKGDVVVVSDSGASATLVNGWTTLAVGKVTKLTPSKGELNTVVAIHGERLLGGGQGIQRVFLAGAEAEVLDANNSMIMVRSTINVPQVGDVEIYGNLEAYIVMKGGWEYNAVNDAPTIAGPALTKLSEDDKPLPISIVVSDTDAEEIDGNMLVSVSVTQGKISIGEPIKVECDDVTVDGKPWHDAGGASFDCAWYSAAGEERCSRLGGDSRSAFGGYTANKACCTCGGGIHPTFVKSLLLVHPLAELNQILAKATYQPPVDYNGDDVILVRVNDQGNSGSGGAKSATEQLGLEIAEIGRAHV